MAVTRDDALKRARVDLAERLGVSENEIEEGSIEETDFPDLALGAPVAAIAAQPITCTNSSPPTTPSLKVISYAVVYSPVPSTLIRASIPRAWTRSRAAQYSASPSCPGSLLAICSYTFTECW